MGHNNSEDSICQSLETVTVGSEAERDKLVRVLSGSGWVVDDSDLGDKSLSSQLTLKGSSKSLMIVCREDSLASNQRLDWYKNLSGESAVFEFSSSELAELGSFTPPIFEKLLGSGLYDTAELSKLKIAVQEALANALEHGNLELKSSLKEEIGENGQDRFAIIRSERLKDPNYAVRIVTLKSDFRDQTLTFTVTDQGVGFLNEAQPLALSDKNELGGVRCSGRGLHLISSAVDELYFDKNGSQIRLVKRL